MAAATDSIVNARSPRSSSSTGLSGVGGGGENSPQSRRNGKNLSAPWAHVVRGESEAAVTVGPSTSSSQPAVAAAAAANEQIPDSSDCSSLKVSSSVVDTSSAALDMQMEGSDNNSNNNVNAGQMTTAAAAKKLAWNNKPSNGGGDAEFCPVMGAHSWPALSESARASTKSASESLKTTPPEGSVSVPQGPVIASTPQKQVTSNVNPNPTPNHAPTRQKSMKRGGNGGSNNGGGGNGGGAGLVNGGFPQPPPLPLPSPAVETSQNSSGKTGPVIPDSSPRDPHHRNNNHWEGGPRGGFMSPLHAGNDHPQPPQRNFRRNNGSHPRGNGSYHNNNFSGRQERDHANYEWNSHRNFNGRNAHMQQQQQQQRVVSGNFPRPPPPNAAPFISPPPVPSFGSPIGYPLFYVPNAPPGAMPMVPPQPFGVFVHPPPDGPLRTKIARQIDYYFSSENLCKDTYLREQMDDEGWVSISVIAAFKRVMQLNNNIPFILDALRTSSTVVEVQENKVRRRNDWMNWPRLLPNQFVPASLTQSSGVSNQDGLADRFQNVGLMEGNSANNNYTTRNQGDIHADLIVSRSSTDELNNQSTSLQ